MEKETITLLRKLANRYETADFMTSDPSQFMHHYANPTDQEAMGFVASCLSFGQRKQFLKKIKLIEQAMKKEPAKWIFNGLFRNSHLFDGVELNSSFYRMVTYGDLIELFEKMARTNLFEMQRKGTTICTAETLQKHWATPHLVPRDTKSTCKRLHMFLRWMVRTNSPVDLGIWTEWISPSSLIIPLDVHVCQEATKLGLIKRPTMSLTTAKRITEQAHEVFPNDPVRVDFALFGLGVDNSPNQ